MAAAGCTSVSWAPTPNTTASMRRRYDMVALNIRPIRTEADYRETLAQIDGLIDVEPGTPDADLLEVLSVLVADYEERHHPIPPPDALMAIRFRMEQMGLKPKDLVKYIGSVGRVSEVLNGKRPLSKAMIR